MTSKLQNILEKRVAELPRRFVEELFRKKLSETGLDTKEELVEKLVDHVLSGREDNFTWDSGENCDVELTITEKDIQDLDKKIKKFTDEQLPKVVEDITTNSARKMLRDLKRNWPEQHTWESQIETEFRDRLEYRWAEPLALLRMILTISREIGAERYKKFSRSRAVRNRYRNEVLLRLHARGCQVTAEIIHLLTGGFADGAMARWRTLHEIGIVATLVAEHGDELAERYLAHEIAESKRGLRAYADAYQQLGHRPPSKRDAERVDKLLSAAVAKFGAEFKEEYGWAAKILKNRKPRFADLEAAAGRAMMRSHYKMASHSVHAGVKGITFKLGWLGKGPVMIAGASNAGLDEPGQNTAMTLIQITFTLFNSLFSLENIIVMKVLADLQEQAITAFVRAGRRLECEEKKRWKLAARV